MVIRITFWHTYDHSLTSSSHQNTVSIELIWLGFLLPDFLPFTAGEEYHCCWCHPWQNRAHGCTFWSQRREYAEEKIDKKEWCYRKMIKFAAPLGWTNQKSERISPFWVGGYRPFFADYSKNIDVFFWCVVKRAICLLTNGSSQNAKMQLMKIKWLLFSRLA